MSTMMTLNITQEDIDEAVDRREGPGFYTCSDCVVARAMTKLLGTPIEAGDNRAFYGSSASIAALFPEELSDYIWRFDMNKEIQPQTFQILVEEKNVSGSSR